MSRRPDPAEWSGDELHREARKHPMGALAGILFCLVVAEDPVGSIRNREAYWLEAALAASEPGIPAIGPVGVLIQSSRPGPRSSGDSRSSGDWRWFLQALWTTWDAADRASVLGHDDQVTRSIQAARAFARLLPVEPGDAINQLLDEISARA